MAIYIFGVGASAHKLTVAGTDLSDHVKSVTINMPYDDVDVTAMNSTSHAHAPGLRDDSIEIEYFQDFASSSVDVTNVAIAGSTTGGTVIFQTSGTTVSTTNPKYTLVATILDYTPVDASVGDASMNKVKYVPIAGQSITRATS